MAISFSTTWQAARLPRRTCPLPRRREPAGSGASSGGAPGADRESEYTMPSGSVMYFASASAANLGVLKLSSKSLGGSLGYR